MRKVVNFENEDKYKKWLGFNESHGNFKHHTAKTGVDVHINGKHHYVEHTLGKDIHFPKPMRFESNLKKY